MYGSNKKRPAQMHGAFHRQGVNPEEVSFVHLRWPPLIGTFQTLTSTHSELRFLRR
ncbi:hypothetical protein BJ994_002254 [Arthrobacter pigmenti]|uniref:Uncharacterized protein n=1 Tax=Arthrobacter pigmenti TaxID=271432 RepID=A0A846RIR4_9MICC|nr:hypothetical protein [Arthrobacter pigmenti]